MKTANAPASDASSSRRLQPLRQARTNPARSSSNGRSGGREPLDGADQPIDIFPAITHFADAMTALPKEVVRHFTLLKEVDAKIFAPEDDLFGLVAATANSSPAQAAANNEISGSAAAAQQSSSNIQDVSANTKNDNTIATAEGQSTSVAAPYDLANLKRRTLFRQTAIKIQELLVSLEEKNHVLSTANEVLQRQLDRVDDVWPYLLNEFSDEAKWGSSTHWAYPENRTGRPSLAERTRRDGAAAISAAAQALADEAAARSDARKQAMQAKKGIRNNQHHLDSDFDDHDAKSIKKPQSAKRGKAAAEAGVTGLGISNAGPVNGNPPTKRRKVEKPSIGGTAMERALSGTLGEIAPPFKGKIASPAGTPAPDGTKKRKALPTGSGQPKKSRNTAPGASPSVISSPVITNLPEPKTAARASPNPTSTVRPTTSRARGSSIHSNAENGKVRPPSATSIPKPNGKAQEPIEPGPSSTWPKPSIETKAPREPPAPVKQEAAKKEVEKTDTSTSTVAPSENKSTTKTEESERKSEVIPPLPTTMATVTTKSGRASKPSTPALQQFQDAAAMARPRSSRNNDSNGNGNTNGSSGAKKHQKRASTASQALTAKVAVEEDTNSSVPGDDDEEEIDANEPTYCYCNAVSYGEMVACDADGCEREWFHLACVGLKTAPGQKTKWYCEPCKKRLQMTSKKVNGR